MNVKSLAAIAIALSFSTQAFAGEGEFTKGPIFTTMGQAAQVKADMTIPKNTRFAVAFDTAKAAKVGEINSTLNTAARFINMHAAAGVKKKHMKLAVVVHSKAAFDLTKDSYYGGKYEGTKNVNASAIEALTDNNVRIILCGQTAAYYDIDNSDLLPNVEMALSAMTAHTLLQQEGYTLNPF